MLVKLRLFTKPDFIVGDSFRYSQGVSVVCRWEQLKLSPTIYANIGLGEYQMLRSSVPPVETKTLT